MSPARWWFFVASRYDTFSGQLISEFPFYTNAHPDHADDPELWAHRFIEGQSRLDEGVHLVVRQVSRSAFNKISTAMPTTRRQRQA